MNEVSKDTLISNLQQRMDKCTNEQFWAVAAMIAFYAALIARASALPTEIPKWLVAVVLSATAFYAAFFVIHRHKAYYSYRKDFAELLTDCSVAPQFMKKMRN